MTSLTRERVEYWHARSQWAQDRRSPVYITDVEWAELEATAPEPEPESAAWVREGEAPQRKPDPRDGATVFGVVLVVDNERAAEQYAQWRRRWDEAHGLRRIEDAFACDPDCEHCGGLGAVCEDHPDVAFGDCCGAAGMPCREGNRR